MNKEQFIKKWKPTQNIKFESDNFKFDDFDKDLDSLNEWISVKDELPEDNENNKEFNVVIGSESTFAYWDSNKNRFYWKAYYVKVTHWQPLPKLPKE